MSQLSLTGWTIKLPEYRCYQQQNPEKDIIIYHSFVASVVYFTDCMYLYLYERNNKVIGGRSVQRSNSKYWLGVHIHMGTIMDDGILL